MLCNFGRIGHRFYDEGGYRDWFLPSKDELNLMYRSLKVRGLGGFSSYYYWTSSETPGSYPNRAWSQRFSDGLQEGSRRGGKYLLSSSVRAF